MDTKEIQKRVDALAAAMAEKGIVRPKAQYQIQSHQDSCVVLQIGQFNSFWNYDCEVFNGGGLSPLNDAESWVAEQLSAKERKFGEFMTAVAAAVDMGRQNGIDVEFVNPLAETLKKLSENAITDQRVSK